jgi:hypothetical protein
MSEGIFVDELLDGPDAHRVRASVQDAPGFAQSFLRTDSGADFRHVAGRTRQRRSLEELSIGSEGEPFGYAIGQRATCDALGRGTLQASSCLLAYGGFVIERVNFMEIGDAFFD